MGNRKEQISERAFMFTVGCFVQSSTMLLGFITSVSKQDTWICSVIGLLLSFPIIWLFVRLGEMFPGKNLIDINIIVFGNIVGKIISAVYVFFFFSLTFLNFSVAGEFVAGALLPETPELATVIVLVLLCGYAVRKGLEPITRCSVFITVLVLAFIIFNSFLLIREMKISNFLPIFAQPTKSYFQATHSIIVMPFCNIFVFTMLFPVLKTPHKIKKPLFGGLLIGAFTLLFVVIRDTAVMGSIMRIVTTPTFDSVRLINIANTLTRMEILYAIILLSLMFFKLAIFYYATAKGIAQLFNLRSINMLIPSLGAIIVVFSITAFDSSIGNGYNASNYAQAYQSVFEIVLPLITLLVALLRKRKIMSEARI